MKKIFIHTLENTILSNRLSKILFRMYFIFYQFQLTVVVSRKRSAL